MKKKVNILLIEPKPLLMNLTKKAIENKPESEYDLHIVKAVTTAKEGFNELSKQLIHILIVNPELEQNGLDFIHQALTDYHHLKVIVVLSSRLLDEQTFYNIGVHEVFQVPLQRAALWRKMDELIEELNSIGAFDSDFLSVKQNVQRTDFIEQDNKTTTPLFEVEENSNEVIRNTTEKENDDSVVEENENIFQLETKQANKDLFNLQEEVVIADDVIILEDEPILLEESSITNQQQDLIVIEDSPILSTEDNSQIQNETMLFQVNPEEMNEMDRKEGLFEEEITDNVIKPLDTSNHSYLNEGEMPVELHEKENTSENDVVFEETDSSILFNVAENESDTEKENVFSDESVALKKPEVLFNIQEESSINENEIEKSNNEEPLIFSQTSIEDEIIEREIPKLVDPIESSSNEENNQEFQDDVNFTFDDKPNEKEEKSNNISVTPLVSPNKSTQPVITENENSSVAEENIFFEIENHNSSNSPQTETYLYFDKNEYNKANLKERHSFNNGFYNRDGEFVSLYPPRENFSNHHTNKNITKRNEVNLSIQSSPIEKEIVDKPKQKSEEGLISFVKKFFKSR